MNMRWAEVKEILSSCRLRSRHRFSKQSDWMRLTALGYLLVLFAAFDLAFMFTPRAFLDPAGLSIAFSGAAIVVMITKIAQPDVYLDWILNGALCIGIGILFHIDGTLPRSSLLAGACLLLALSSSTRIWIGLTAFPPRAAQWLFVSGCFAAAGSILIALAAGSEPTMAARWILAADVLHQGLCIIGFGNALNTAR